MKFMKKIIPLAIGAFFLTTNADLPDEVIIVNETSQNDMFVYGTYNESYSHIGYSISINETKRFHNHQEKQLNFLYVYNDWRTKAYNHRTHKFSNYMEKINLEYVINYFLLNVTSREKVEDLELDNFKIQSFYSTDNQLIIILKDLD